MIFFKHIVFVAHNFLFNLKQTWQIHTSFNTFYFKTTTTLKKWFDHIDVLLLKMNNKPENLME